MQSGRAWVGLSIALSAVVGGGCNQLFGIEAGTLAEGRPDGGATGDDASGEDDGACAIEGGMYAAGTAKAGDGCQSCQPGVTATGWSPAADGTKCGSNGVCRAGTCVSGCEIGGVYYLPDQANPANACEVCRPALSRSSWSGCTAGHVCDGATCIAGCLIGSKVFAPDAANAEGACQSCQPSLSTSAWSATTGNACRGTTGGTCAAGTCVMPPSCEPGGPGMNTCPGGNGTESCCTSHEVVGGTYYRTYANDGTGAKGTKDAATVHGFRLDRYEVTVGRFRQFVTAWNNGKGWTPPEGSGKHVHLNDGQGLTNSGAVGAFESGWSTVYDSSLAPIARFSGCGTTATWTAAAGSNESRPINCVSWYEAAAFCVWDGGFLPSEAEWGYAAAGGSEQRAYPWGTTAPGASSQYAIYNCYCPTGSSSCTGGVTNMAAVGYASQGFGKWGQLDLAGSVWEWTLDWRTDFANPCVDCANTSAATARTFWGGGFNVDKSQFPPFRGGDQPERYGPSVGFRCARTP
jgi:formylglycine-generating enzyme